MMSFPREIMSCIYDYLTVGQVNIVAQTCKFFFDSRDILPNNEHFFVELKEDGRRLEVPFNEICERVISLKEVIQSVAMLSWAKKAGCPWNKGLVNCIVEYGDLDMLQWAIENKCEYSLEYIRDIAVFNGKDTIFEWTLQVGHINCNAEEYYATVACEKGFFNILIVLFAKNQNLSSLMYFEFANNPHIIEWLDKADW